MTKRLLLSLVILLGISSVVFAQTSQVSGNIQCPISFTLVNTNNPNGISQFPLSVNLASLAIQTGNSGTNVGNANQLFAARVTLTNGALTGTNWLNLNLLNVTNSSTAGTDPVGNAYALTNLKLLAIQNLGSGTAYGAYETNIFQIQNPTGASAWTNFLGATNVGITLRGPTTNSQVQGTFNYPMLMLFDPGDVGYPVAVLSNNIIVLTNPVAGSAPVTANIIIIGSTGL